MSNNSECFFKKFMLISPNDKGIRARVWFLVNPSQQRVLIRWVGGSEEWVSIEAARAQWTFLWRVPGFRTPEYLNKMQKRKEMVERSRQLRKHYEQTGSWKEEEYV